MIVTSLLTVHCKGIGEIGYRGIWKIRVWKILDKKPKIN